MQVVKVGAGKKKEDSEEMVKPNVEVGQTVMYSKYSGTEFEVCICISVRAFLCVLICAYGMYMHLCARMLVCSDVQHDSSRS